MPSRVVALFAHPDDEAYSAAGTLALCARAGAEVHVVCATRGEAGGDRSGSGLEVGALRTAELERACTAIGAEPPRFLEQPDGAVDAARLGRLREILAELEPAVLITHGRDGAYGNLDHTACTVMAAASAAAGTRILEAAFPRGLFVPVRRAVKRAYPQVIDPRICAEHLGTDASAVDLRVDVRAVRDAKLAAVAAHRSQLCSDDPMGFLGPGLLAPLLEEEWFVHTAGPALPPGATDPLAGLS